MNPLKDWLGRNGTTQAELAGKVGVSRAHLSRIANGDPRISLGVAAKLEEITGIPASRFAANSAADHRVGAAA